MNKTNHWIFQCNPNVYDIVGALQGKSVASWRVTSHTNEIKIGDKIILWVTGKQSGCYALGEVSGEIEYSVRNLEEQKFYKDNSYNVPSNRVKVSIIHNLADNPILKSKIDGLKDLSEMNAGLQGTNFKATEKQYKALEKIALTKESAAIIEDKHFDTETTAAQYKSDLYPLNMIFYGPPGTGKTYNSVQLAVAIADNLNGDDLVIKYPTRTDITARYRELVEQGRVTFTTFHQSMSYEDFIEGIKPLSYNNQIEYRIIDGILKQICTKATYSAYMKEDKGALKRDALFEIAYDVLLEMIGQEMAKDICFELVTKEGRPIEIIEINDNQNLIIIHKSEITQTKHIVSKQRLLKLFLKFKDITDIKRVTKDIDGVIGGSNASAYWAVLNKLYKLSKDIDVKSEQGQKNQFPDYDSMSTIIEGYKWRTDYDTMPDMIDSYVLIIDEINRGNVSQIFGELITLIEPDKRAGNSEGLEILLPYSKTRFSVPPNLYIIGTMNTADRSVGALDTALRRRFSFVEMAPRYDLLEDADYFGISLKALLEKINLRIEGLLDKDHAIGHSYFLRVTKGEIGLKQVFFNEIIPLLQEYFYGNYGRIELILGSGFVKSYPIKQTDYATPSSENEEFVDRIRYSLVREEDMDDIEFQHALEILLG